MDLEFWHWLAGGLLFLVGEILFSGFFLIWLGVGAVAVGLIMLVAPDLDVSIAVGIVDEPDVAWASYAIMVVYQ